MLKIFLSFILIFILNLNLKAQEGEYFLMLKYDKVNVRYGPSRQDQVKFFYKKKYLPLKIIDKKENFRKIIDHKNNSGWIHRSQLKPSKSIIILEDKIVFKKASIYSEPLVKLKKGRLVVITKCKINWCKVKTNQFNGWLGTQNVWGLN